MPLQYHVQSCLDCSLRVKTVAKHPITPAKGVEHETSELKGPVLVAKVTSSLGLGYLSTLKTRCEHRR